MIFAAGTMILAILFSLSRGGILAMVLVALLLLVLLPFSKIGKTRLPGTVCRAHCRLWDTAGA